LGVWAYIENSLIKKASKFRSNIHIYTTTIVIQVNQCAIVYNNKILTKNRIWFICAHIWLRRTCIQVIGISFMNFCICAYSYILLCIQEILSLFMSLRFSFILSWIIWIEFVMVLNIHQVFEVSLEEQSVCSNEEALFFFFCFLIHKSPNSRFFG